MYVKSRKYYLMFKAKKIRIYVVQCRSSVHRRLVCEPRKTDDGDITAWSDKRNRPDRYWKVTADIDMAAFSRRVKDNVLSEYLGFSLLIIAQLALMINALFRYVKSYKFRGRCSLTKNVKLKKITT